MIKYFNKIWNTPPRIIATYLKNMLYKLVYKNPDSLDDLNKFKRYTETSIRYLNHDLKIVDSASFLFFEDEIFQKEIYRFKTDNLQPRIIDCGANIGASVIYFKRLYPDARIDAFEPDKKIFESLKFNIKSFDLKNVELHNTGLWNKDTVLSFYAEGADGGRIAVKGDKDRIIKIKTERLSPYLNDHVDFLKIDIEGAEYRVLEESKDYLHNVDRVFIEYHSFVAENQKDLSRILLILNEAGYRVNINTPGLNSPQPFIFRNINEKMDMQLNIYAFRTEETKQK